MSKVRFQGRNDNDYNDEDQNITEKNLERIARAMSIGT